MSQLNFLPAASLCVSDELARLADELMVSFDELEEFSTELWQTKRGTQKFADMMGRHVPIASRHRSAVDAICAYQPKNPKELLFKARLSIDYDADGCNRAAVSVILNLLAAI